VIVIHIYIAIQKSRNNSYQKQADENFSAEARFFKEMYSADKPAKNNEVKKE
jgi:hypothetical protein